MWSGPNGPTMRSGRRTRSCLWVTGGRSRARFKKSPPRTVDPDYLQSVLGLGSAKAAANLIPPLKVIGLIDDNGALTDLANDWRSDEHYSDACGKTLSAVYPDRLRSAFPPPDPDVAGVTAWFARNAGVGEAAAQQMARFYRLVSEADIDGEEAKPKHSASSGPTPSAGAAKKRGPPGQQRRNRNVRLLQLRRQRLILQVLLGSRRNQACRSPFRSTFPPALLRNRSTPSSPAWLSTCIAVRDH